MTVSFLPTCDYDLKVKVKVKVKVKMKMKMKMKGKGKVCWKVSHTNIFFNLSAIFWLTDRCVADSWESYPSFLARLVFNQAALRERHFTSMHCMPSFTPINKSVN